MTFTTGAATIADITVITLPATDVTDYSATLNGTVNPHGCTAPGGGVGWSFPIGKTSSYGIKGSAAGTLSPTSTVSLNASGTITGLEPNTKYHFQLTASGPCGGGAGKDLTLTTSGDATPLMVTLGGGLGLAILGFAAFKLGWIATLTG